MNRIKKTEIESDLPLKLAKPALRALHANNYHTLKELSKTSEDELSKLHGIGPDAIVQIKKAMKDKALSFAGKK